MYRLKFLIISKGGFCINFKFQISNSNLKKRGFTITEIILLLVIVGIMITGILPVFLNVITYNKTAEYRSTAYKMADSKMESLRYGTFDNIPTTSDTPITNLPNGHLVVTSSNLVDGAVQTNIKLVEVKVVWNFKRPEEVKLTTYITSNGIKK